VDVSIGSRRLLLLVKSAHKPGKSTNQAQISDKTEKCLGCPIFEEKFTVIAGDFIIRLYTRKCFIETEWNFVVNAKSLGSASLPFLPNLSTPEIQIHLLRKENYLEFFVSRVLGV
jgi:hypothetical protein